MMATPDSPEITMPNSTTDQVRASEKKRGKGGEVQIRSPLTWVEEEHEAEAKRAGDAAWKAAVEPYKRARRKKDK